MSDLKLWTHDPDCDTNDVNPDGIRKPCNCCIVNDAVTNKPKFWQRGLAVLHQITREPVASVDELKALQRQLEAVILMVESGGIVPMSEQERIEHASRFGRGAFVVGDFVIIKRTF